MGSERDDKKLYETGETLNRELQKMIDMQAEQIQNLINRNSIQEKTISLLTEENSKLEEALNELTRICKEQQEWIDKLLGSE